MARSLNAEAGWDEAVSSYGQSDTLALMMPATTNAFRRSPFSPDEMSMLQTGQNLTMTAIAATGEGASGFMMMSGKGLITKFGGGLLLLDTADRVQSMGTGTMYSDWAVRQNAAMAGGVGPEDVTDVQMNAFRYSKEGAVSLMMMGTLMPAGWQGKQIGPTRQLPLYPQDKFEKLVTALEKQNYIVYAGDKMATDKLTEIGAHAGYYPIKDHPGIFYFPRNPSRLHVVEELLHAQGYKLKGWPDPTSELRLQFEIEAHQKMQNMKVFNSDELRYIDEVYRFWLNK